MFVFFFFSSRRRHTRCSRDWSSDVCSSDLIKIDLAALKTKILECERGRGRFSRLVVRRRRMRSNRKCDRPTHRLRGFAKAELDEIRKKHEKRVSRPRFSD